MTDFPEFKLPGLPTKAEIDEARAKVDEAIDGVTKALDFIESHETIAALVGLKSYLPAIKAADNLLKDAKSVIDRF